MKINLIIKIITGSFLLFLFACSNNSLENLGLLKKKANEYSISRKAPLVMPPDMFLRPPKSENKPEKPIKADDLELGASLDDILLGKKNTNNPKKNDLNQINKENRIVRKILGTKAIKIIKP